ncbi:MAG TPA: nitroreductase [Allosphingosinicella sp.]|nr:nitroreductase [Allosphingosinicella sp.]
MASVTETVLARRSVRAFLDRPVDRATIAEILETAARAPSGGNLQPWHVDVLAGAALADLKRRVRAGFAAGPAGEGTEFPVYPPALGEPWRSRRHASGEQLYAAIGIPREHRLARLGQFAKNYELFGAPVGLFFSIPRSFGLPQWAHLGMFMQNIMLLAGERGLATCAQEAWALVHKTVGESLNLPEDRIFYCGMALGYADEDHPINGWRTEREPLESFATFSGF